MEFVKKYSAAVAVVAFFVGFAVGLFVFGWGITPVQWTSAGPQDLATDYGGINYQELYLRNAAELYAFSRDQNRAQLALQIWPDANVRLCAMADASQDPDDRARLQALAAVNSVDRLGCASSELATMAEEAESAGPNILVVCVVALLFFLIVALIALVIVRRGGSRGDSGGSGRGYAAERPPAYGSAAGLGTPTTDEDEAVENVSTQAIARFRTTFTMGNDTYDDSFPIENTNGDFLGECGVGVSESIGTETPRSVTAFEVWLFDKNDIRTITKVVMSDHAFFDDALKAKLSPKGEPVLARVNEIVVLETASLIINAEVVEMEYGADPTLPPESYFDRFTIELSAWTKESSQEAAGGVDDALNF